LEKLQALQESLFTKFKSKAKSSWSQLESQELPPAEDEETAMTTRESPSTSRKKLKSFQSRFQF
jgi:hypothetical protein